jgi:hypothetical protein
MNTRTRAPFGNAPLFALACLTLAVQAGSASAADELTGVAVAPRPGQAGAPLQTGKALALPAQQATQATQATQAKQATAVGSQVPLARPTGIQLGIPAPTLGNTAPLVVGSGQAKVNTSAVQVNPIAIEGAPNRNDVRLKLAAGTGIAGTGTTNNTTGMAGNSSATTSMAGTGNATTNTPAGMAATGTAHPGADASRHPPQDSHPGHCAECGDDRNGSASDTDLALARQHDAERQATRLLGEPSRARVNSYVITRSNADELAAQSAAIARMRAGQPVQGLSVRNWIDWQFKHQTYSAPQQPAGPGAAPAKVMTVDDGSTGAGAANPCVPPPPVTGNPEFFQLQRQREELLSKARALAATDRRSPELARLERDIQALEAKLRSMDAFLDPCNRETTRAQNETARAALNLPDRLPLKPEIEDSLRKSEEFANTVRTRIELHLREPGQSYYEDWIGGEREWRLLPDSEKRQWADAEQRLMNDLDDRSLRDWRARADAEEARARDAAQAARQAAFNLRYEAEQAEAQAAEAAAAAKRKAEQQRAQGLARRDALDAEARALNQELRSVIASGDKARQREIEARLDQITQMMTTQFLPDARERAATGAADTKRMADLDAGRAAAQRQAAADARQAAVDRKRDLEQQNRNVLTRSTNMAAGFGVAAGKAGLEVVQMGLDGVSTGMRAADVGDPGPNRSTIGQLWDNSKGVGEFGGHIWDGLIGMFTGAWTHLTEGDARGFGEDLFNVGSMAAAGAGGPKPPAAGVARSTGQAAATAPKVAARAAGKFDVEAFRVLTPDEQARALAGQSEPVRTGVLQHLTPDEQAAFVQADGARALANAPRGLVDSPDGVFTFLTKEGERVIVGDDLHGLSAFEDIVPHGTYTSGMSAAEIEALLAKGPPYTSTELLAKLELVYDGRAPRLVMDADTARAMFQVMVRHFREVNHRMPTPDELAPLLRALEGTSPPAGPLPAMTAGAEAPFGYGPTGTLASKPLPNGGVPDWLAKQGANAQALPPQLRQAPIEHELPAAAPRPDISSMGTVRQ